MGVFLYRIYQNTGESYKVRARAAQALIESNPPYAMLERMAKFTNYDISKHVNSMVKSMIENVAELKGKEFEDMARKARAVRDYLTPEEYDVNYSMGWLLNENLEKLNIKYRAALMSIGSEDSFIPLAVKTEFEQEYGNFKSVLNERSLAVSSIDRLMRVTKKLFKNVWRENEEREEKNEIADLLKMEPQKKKKLQMLYHSRNKYGNYLMAMDEDMMKPIPEGMNFSKWLF